MRSRRNSSGRPIYRLLAAAAISGAIALGLGASPAQSSASSATGPGWVTYPLPAGVDPALTVREQVQGQHVLTGCVFSFTGRATRGTAGREEDEVAFNPATCQAVYAVGPIQHAGQGDRGAGSAGNGSGASAGRGDPTLAFFMKTFYEDPVGIDVTSLREDLEWTYSGGCNTSDKWKRNATWYTPSGWYLRYVNDSPSFGCNNAVINSDALMENDLFCPVALNDPESVYTHYNYNHEVIGKPNGTAVYAWNDYVDSTLGLCYRLLSHHNSQNFETPW